MSFEEWKKRLLSHFDSSEFIKKEEEGEKTYSCTFNTTFNLMIDKDFFSSESEFKDHVWLHFYFHNGSGKTIYVYLVNLDDHILVSEEEGYCVVNFYKNKHSVHKESFISTSFSHKKTYELIGEHQLRHAKNRLEFIF